MKRLEFPGRWMMLVATLVLAVCGMVNAADTTPVIQPDAAVMKFDELGLYGVGYAYRGKPEVRFPVGWQGFFEENTGVCCQPAAKQNGKAAFLLHCPWRAGTGVTFQEFAVALPGGDQVKRIMLRGATAMRAAGTEKSNGITFHIYLDGKRVLDVHRRDTAWQDFSFDLTPSAGKTITIRFETDPGPKDDPSFGFSVWGDRELVLEGFATPEVKHPAPPAVELARLLSAQSGTVAPASAFAGQTAAKIEGDTATLSYAGADGQLGYRWQLPAGGGSPALGTMRLYARMAGDDVVELPLASDAAIVWTQSAAWVESHWEKADDANAVSGVCKYQVGEKTATLRMTGRILGKSLVLDVACDQPVIKQLTPGKWGPVLRRRTIPVPYCPFRVDLLPVQNLFASVILDWTCSNASSQNEDRASYEALTNGTRHPLRERVAYCAGWHLDEALPNIPNPPSPHIGTLADRLVLDLWGGTFAELAKRLQALADMGVDHAVVLVHDWQHLGYDNGYPGFLPAAERLGGDAAMNELAATAARLGYLFALHENYVDYYTNYDAFDANDIALDAQGKRQLAWFNPGTRLQSFAVKPTAIARLAATQSPVIHERFGTSACFLDVHSAVAPWFHVDQRAGEPGAGLFATVWEAHKALWQYERQTHQGPVFGEGNRHMYWSGLLDGAEAQFGQGWPDNEGMTAPLLVDFDLLKIHPLQLNHGMGYFERWWPIKGYGNLPPLVVLDQYRMQEAIFAHAGFLNVNMVRDGRPAWLEHHLLTPLTQRIAAAKPVRIDYLCDGRWLDATGAAKAGDFRRPRVKYDNELTLVANDSPDEWNIDGLTLPRFGWLAQGAGLKAYTAMRDGVVVDFAQTPDSVFVNARGANTWDFGDVKAVKPSVVDFTATGARSCRFSYHWQIATALKQDYTCFVHFEPALPPHDAPGEPVISFQDDHAPSSPTSQWQAGQALDDGPRELTIPADVPAGDYRWLIGLYRQDTGRIALEGTDAGGDRVLLGIVHVADGGKALGFDPARDTSDVRQALYQQHVNTKNVIIDFGPVRTNASVLIRREGRDWVLRGLPAQGDCTVELAAESFGTPTQITCVGGKSATITPAPTAPPPRFWVLPLNGAAQYRWAVSP